MSRRRMSQEYSFAQVPQAQIPRSAFNRSHGHKTTMDSGVLVPLFVDEVLPGDTFTVNAAVMARLSTPLVPSMDNLYMDFFFFYVPNRLVWTNWPKLMGEQANPGDSTDYLCPLVNSPGVGGFTVGSMADYFGIPTGVNFAASKGPQAFAFRAYNLIWNEWFRDENLQTRVPQNIGDGPDAAADYVLKRRGKRHDYFTSCLPWPQKPGPGAAYANGVMLPLGTYAPVVPSTTAAGDPTYPGKPGFQWATNPGTNRFPMQAAGVAKVVQLGINNTSGTDPNDLVWSSGGNGGVGWPSAGWLGTGLMADLSHATAATINSLRQAFQIQRLLERDARGGTRYTEIVRSHFGVVSPDQRLQRPEYLGGGSCPVMFHPVAQTAPKGGAGTLTPQGNLAAFGTVHASGIGFHKSFVEHGVILGLAAIRADLSYQQGMHRMWSRRTRFDFFWPAFAHLGEQAVLNKEIYANADANDDLVFGYQERWAEYRYAGSKITGEFRSTFATPLDVWHYAQKFLALPTLGDTFISDTPPIVRNQAVTTEPEFLVDAHFAMRTVRPMPTYSVPGLLDHF